MAEGRNSIALRRYTYQHKKQRLDDIVYAIYYSSMKELTTKEVAEELGISLRQVQTLIQRNRLPATKKGRDWFVLESDLELVRERKKTGRPPKPKDDDKS